MFSGYPSVCMCSCVYIYVYTRISVYIMWVSVCGCLCVCVHQWVSEYRHLSSVCISVCICARVSVSVCVYRVKLWADTFGGDLYKTVTKYSGSLLLQKVSNPFRGAHRGQRAVSRESGGPSRRESPKGGEGSWRSSNPISSLSDGQTETQGGEQLAQVTEQVSGGSTEGWPRARCQLRSLGS